MSSTAMLTSAPHQATTSQAHQNYTDINALGQLKLKAREDQASALKPVAEQFEAIFVQQLLQEARKVSFDDGWLDGNQGDFYKDWSDKQLAQDVAAKGTLGFADNIVKQLAPNIPSLSPEQIKEALSQDKKTEPKGMKPLLEGVSQNNSTEQALALRFASQPKEPLK